MSRHHLDGRVRQLPLMSDEQAVLESDSRAQQALFEEIIAMPIVTDATDASPAVRRPRTARPTLVFVVTLSLLGLGAVGWAVVNSLGSTTSVACHTSDSAVTVVDAVTGDPVADCATVWEAETGDPAPALLAYDNASGGIAVVPADAEVPGDWRPLEPGAVQDGRIIELRVALDDQIAGLTAECHLLDAGRAVAQRELDRLGLSAWSVAARDDDADGDTTCTYFYLDAERQQVVLISMEGVVMPEDTPAARFARDLGVASEDACRSLEDAAELARTSAAGHGIEGEGLMVHEVAVEDRECARLYVTVAGRVEVTVRGPSATR